MSSTTGESDQTRPQTGSHCLDGLDLDLSKEATSDLFTLVINPQNRTVILELDIISTSVNGRLCKATMHNRRGGAKTDGYVSE